MTGHTPGRPRARPPAPTILAFFLNTAIDQGIAEFRSAQGREPSPDEAAAVRARVLATVRGTVQADILKEDQGQNTCIFSTEFSLRTMADNPAPLERLISQVNVACSCAIEDRS